MTTTEMQNFLTTLMRGIDKKTSVSVEVRKQSDQPRIMVHLARDKRSGVMEISEADMLAGQSDLMRRNRVRTALKRARDRMWEETGSFFSTKIERHAPEGFQMSRPGQSFSRGRR